MILCRLQVKREDRSATRTSVTETSRCYCKLYYLYAALGVRPARKEGRERKSFKLDEKAGEQRATVTVMEQALALTTECQIPVLSAADL